VTARDAGSDPASDPASALGARAESDLARIPYLQLILAMPGEICAELATLCIKPSQPTVMPRAIAPQVGQQLTCRSRGGGRRPSEWPTSPKSLQSQSVVLNLQPRSP